MRRVLICAAAILLLCLLCSMRCGAVTLDELQDSLYELRESVSDEVWERMEAFGYSGSITSMNGVGLQGVLTQLVDSVKESLSGPLSCGAVMIGVLILSSLLEGCTCSLRYTETKDILTTVTALMIAAALTAPLVELIHRAVGVIAGAASLMLVYVPILIGIMSFSGHLAEAGGSCAVVMTATQVIAQLSSRFFPQLLCGYLALSVASGASGRVRLNGLCEMLARWIRWFLIFMMTLFAAVMSLQSVIGRASDTVADRAVRFTLSSLIPFIGSAISEAYRTISGSVDLLRSGAGVFVILAVLASFLPVLVQVILWLLSVNLSKYAADALGVGTPAALLSSVGTVLMVLIALVVSVMAVFLIATAVLMRAGGSS